MKDSSFKCVGVGPQLVCPRKPNPLRKSEQLAGECHRSRRLLLLCCALMCASAGQWVIMCIRLWVIVHSVCRLPWWNRLFFFSKFARAVWCPQRSLLRCTLSARGSAGSEWCISGGGVPNIVLGLGFLWLCLWSACGCANKSVGGWCWVQCIVLVG